MGCLGSKQKISKVDLEYLKKHTRYDEATIKEWFKGFRVSFFIFNLFLTAYYTGYILLSLSIRCPRRSIPSFPFVQFVMLRSIRVRTLKYW